MRAKKYAEILEKNGEIIMKTLKTVFALMFVVGLLGISQAFACKLPGSNLLEKNQAVSKSGENEILIREVPRDDNFATRSLVGRYSSYSTATFYVPAINRTLYATCVGVVTFDGQGHFTDREVHSYDGEIVRDEFTGTYTVNSDGTGKMHFTAPDGSTFDYDIVLSDNAKEITFLVELPVPGLVSQGTMKKQ